MKKQNCSAGRYMLTTYARLNNVTLTGLVIARIIWRRVNHSTDHMMRGKIAIALIFAFISEVSLPSFSYTFCTIKKQKVQ